jgi:hypothetical protein
VPAKLSHGKDNGSYSALTICLEVPNPGNAGMRQTMGIRSRIPFLPIRWSIVID